MKKPEKIRITPDMIINDMGLENVANFFCEFDTDGDPLYGVEGEIPKVHPRYDHWWIGQTDLSFTVDLGGVYRITDIYIYNNYGAHPATVRMGTPFKWELDKIITPEGQKWCNFKIDFDTQFINFTFNNNIAPSEMLLYGYKVKNVTREVPEKKQHAKTKLGEFVGMNAFINDADDINRAVNYIREYHPWLWTTFPDGENTTIAVNPSINKAWDFDDYYGRLHKYGINVCPVISSHNKRSPKDGTHPSTDPANYMSFAKMLFQYVARYGSNKDIDPSLIQVAEGQEKKIGLGYLSSIEPLNEPDGTWSGREQYFSPFELAAFLSICYDGHCGTYKNVGVKQADPNMKMSMSGGAGLNMNYLKAIEFWAKYNRADGKLPFDAINAHRYCGKSVDKAGFIKHVDINIEDRGDVGEKVFVGVSPEEGDIIGAFDEILDWRDRYHPELEAWLTEFGWDTNQDFKTSTSAHAYAEYTGRQVQAMWLVREYLLLSSIGLERAAMYMSRDCGPEETAIGKYGSSGLVRFPIEISANNVIQGNKKDSFYYVYSLKEILGNTTFDCEIESLNEYVKVFKYVTDDKKARYAVWCTTSDGTKVPGYKLKVGEGNFILAELANEHYNGKRSDLESNDGYVTVNVSENPIFVIEK